MKTITNPMGYVRVGILSLALIFSAFFNYSYSQSSVAYDIDGQNCVGTSVEWPVAADAVDTGDPSTVNPSSNIHRLWVNVTDDILQFAFTRESTTTGNATYAIYFDIDCDDANSDANRGGAELAMIFSISSGNAISNTDVLEYVSGAYSSSGTTFTGFVGDSAVTTNCAGTNRNFFEFEIAAADLFPDVCDIGGANCGIVNITQMETLAGASPSSAAKDLMIANVGRFMNHAPVADIAPDFICSGTDLDLSGALSTENSTASDATTYDDIVKYEWDWEYNGTFTADYTSTRTGTTPADPIQNIGTLTNTSTTADEYDVALRVTDVFGCTDIIDDHVLTVVPDPTVLVDVVTYDNTGVNWRCEDWVWTHEVDQFNSEDYLGNSLSSFEWTLPDGSVLTGVNPTHQYRPNCFTQYAPADRFVTLVGTDVYGCTATTTFNPAPVPVELVYFKGAVVDGGALLQWQTASELNSDYFVMERSIDGNEFTEIGRIAAAGFSQEMLEYSYFDAIMPLGNVYYRLVQYDFNEEYEIFDPIVLNMAGDEGRIHVTPNPGIDNVTVNMPSNINGGELVILDLAGKEVFSATVDASVKNVSMDIDVSSLPKGLYYVRFGNLKEGFSSQLLQLL